MNIERIRRYERTVNFGDSMSKPLDMADTYPPAEQFADTLPSIPSAYPYNGDEEPTIKMMRPTLEVEVEERGFIKFPGIGLLMALAFGGLFWFLMYAIMFS